MQKPPPVPTAPPPTLEKLALPDAGKVLEKIDAASPAKALVKAWTLPLALSAAVGGITGGAVGGITSAVVAPDAPTAAPKISIATPGAPSLTGGIGRLAVTSEPSAARVTIDGRIVGDTPVGRVDLDSGEHSVVVELSGFAPHVARVAIAAGQPASVHARLEAGSAATKSTGRPRAFAPRGPSRDCSSEKDSCRRRCDDSGWRCRSSCTFCSSCVSSMTSDECRSRCEQCRSGCEQNVDFCENSCDGDYESCRAMNP